MHFWTIRELQFLSSQCPQDNPKSGADRDNLSRTIREHLDCPDSSSHHYKTAMSPLPAVTQQQGVKMKKKNFCIYRIYTLNNMVKNVLSEMVVDYILLDCEKCHSIVQH